MRSSIVRYAFFNIDELFKPMCANCKHYLKDTSSKEHIIRSTCQKFLVKPQNIINHTLKDDKIKGDYTEKHPYALLARFDINMCGLNAKHFIASNK
jgi:hypothetical protein